MNVHFIKDNTNDNYLTRMCKWTPKMYKAQIFTSYSTAKTKQSSVGKKQNKKLTIETYELTLLGNCQ